MAQSQIICDTSAMGKTRVIRTKSWNRSHDFAPGWGALRTPAACRIFLGIATPVAVPIFEIKIVCTMSRKIFHPLWASQTQSQMAYDALILMNRTRTLSVIVSDEAYGGIVVNRRVYKGASDQIA